MLDIFLTICYFYILQAEVCRNADEDNEIHPEFLLKRYDYFGHGECCTYTWGLRRKE